MASISVAVEPTPSPSTAMVTFAGAESLRPSLAVKVKVSNPVNPSAGV